MTTNNQNERLLKFLQAPPDIQEEIDKLLAGKPAVREAQPKGPLLFDMKSGAKFLGCGRVTLWRLIKTGRLGRVEIMPGSFRVRRSDLEAIAAGKKARSS